MSQAAATAKSPRRETTTLDILKTIAVVLMIVDHVGLYFWDDPWLRVLGRPVAVIFGFLIGYSRATRVPASWIFLGLGLSLLNGWLFPGSDDHALDILIALALTRILVPFFERLHDWHPLSHVPLGIVLGLLTVPVNVYLEYGTEVMIMALLGVAVRLDAGKPEQRAGREALGLTALVVMSLVSIRHFGFTGWEAAGCVGLLAATILWLSRFERHALPVPAPLAPVMQFCGRNTLWIYALHLAAMQVGYWMLQESGEAAEEEEEE